MANYGNTITVGGVTLYITDNSPTKRQKTRKIVIGKSITQVKIIGLSAQQWELNISGVVMGIDLATLSTNRAAIEALDDVSVHALVDGIHDGNYYITDLTFSDSGNRGGMSYIYSMTLIEE